MSSEARDNRQSGSSSDERNRPLLDELNARAAWFAARKTRPIWVRLLERPELVKTIEGDQQVPAGTYLCQGEAGDIWPQAADRLRQKYRFTMERNALGMTKCWPRDDGAEVLAIEVDRPFQIWGEWGLLEGKAGDFALKNLADRGTPYPLDIWIVDRKHFEATYERLSGDRSPSA